MEIHKQLLSNIFPNLFTSILRFLGLFPLNSHLKPSLVNSLFSLFLLIVCLFVLVVSVPSVYYFEQVRKDSGMAAVITTVRGSILTRFVKIFYPVIMSLTPSIAIANALRKYKQVPKYFKHVCECDNLLKRDDFFSQQQRRFAVKFISWSLGHSIPVKVFSITSLLLLDVVDEYVMFWVGFLYFIDMIGFVAEIQFVLMCNALRIRFKEINNTIEDMFKPHDIKLEYRMKTFAEGWGKGKQTNKVSSEKSNILNASALLRKSRDVVNVKNVIVTNATKTSPMLVMPFENDDLNKSSGSFFYKDFASYTKGTVEVSEVELSSRLLRLRRSHRHLSKALHNLQEMFRVVLFATLFASFLMVLINSYFAIYGFVKIFILSNRFDVCFWILKTLFRFTCPLIMSDFTTREARKSIELLSSHNSQTLTKHSREELEYFCQEVDSRELTVSCAFNLFVLNTKLITAAVAASTTYIVILVQLRDAY